LSYYVPGQKPGGDTTCHAKRAGRRPDPKSDGYSEINLEITVELKMFGHFVKFWLTSKILIFAIFYGSALCLTNE
jgi:hypothetical protein